LPQFCGSRIGKPAGGFRFISPAEVCPRHVPESVIAAVQQCFFPFGRHALSITPICLLGSARNLAHRLGVRVLHVKDVAVLSFEQRHVDVVHLLP
jgi:hypothetical protein